VLSAKMNKKSKFPIIAIGASAGGIKALEKFFQGLLTQKIVPLSFIYVTHLDPDQKSNLVEIIQNFTSLRVVFATDGMPIKPNSIYIAPPNHNLSFFEGKIHLQMHPDSVRLNWPIDHLFYSLATELKDEAIAIILSGAGSDGTLGLTALKNAGGVAMVQTPKTAEFSSMPESAIATNLADYILPPDQMAAKLLTFLTSRNKSTLMLKSREHKNVEMFNTIFNLLQTVTGHDFSEYKPNTIIRRVERRMDLHQIDQLQSYVKFLSQNTTEVFALLQDLLIGVTQFFRDPEAFRAIEEKIIPSLFLNKSSGDSIRVWSVGCSSGEEAYSIAILIQEYIEKINGHFKVLIFATDINNNALSIGRQGLYPGTVAEHISPERFARFFTFEPNSGFYKIHKTIREMLIFSDQDVIKDPPLSKLDLVVCRNLLIYMNMELQTKVMQQFQYALAPHGFLFLGSSESISELTKLFVTIDRKLKIYQRIESRVMEIQTTKREISTRQLRAKNNVQIPESKTMKISSNETKLPLREITEKNLLLQLAPTAVLVNEQFEILYLNGRTGLYLEPAIGVANMNILKMAREGLRSDLTAALKESIQKNETIQVEGIGVQTNDSQLKVNLIIRPVIVDQNLNNNLKYYLVIFDKDGKISSDEADSHITSKSKMEDKKKIELLEEELSENEELLKTAQIESIMSNQEIQSSNEELQTANEELQTSKEELQSVNEELATINSELHLKVIELSHANNDMNNLLAGSGIGTIFVDHKKTIVRFTPSATKLVNLIQSDIGRPLGHIVNNFKNYTTLLDDVHNVLDDLVTKETDIQTHDGNWFHMRIRPYRTLENIIEGAVITFFDINELNKMQNALNESNDTARLLSIIIRDTQDSVIVLDLNGFILALNPAAQMAYGLKEQEAIGMNIRELMVTTESSDGFEKIYKVSKGPLPLNYQTKRVTKDGTILNIYLTATALIDHEKKQYAIVTIERLAGKL